MTKYWTGHYLSCPQINYCGTLYCLPCPPGFGAYNVCVVRREKRIISVVMRVCVSRTVPLLHAVMHIRGKQAGRCEDRELRGIWSSSAAEPRCVGRSGDGCGHWINDRHPIARQDWPHRGHCGHCACTHSWLQHRRGLASGVSRTDQRDVIEVISTLHPARHATSLRRTSHSAHIIGLSVKKI